MPDWQVKNNPPPALAPLPVLSLENSNNAVPRQPQREASGCSSLSRALWRTSVGWSREAQVS